MPRRFFRGASMEGEKVADGNRTSRPMTLQMTEGGSRNRWLLTSTIQDDALVMMDIFERL